MTVRPAFLIVGFSLAALGSIAAPTAKRPIVDPSSLITVLVTFALTGVVGNRLLQGWQQRSWLRQQRFLGEEKDYNSLKKIVDEISALSGARLYAMKRLYSLIYNSSLAEMELGLNHYDSILKRWNDNLNSFYVGLTLYDRRSTAIALEYRLQNPFFRCGQRLELAIRARRAETPLPPRADLGQELDHASATLFNMNRDLLARLESLRKKVYYGVPLKFDRYTLQSFTTWELFKALFIRDIDKFTVVRSTLDS